MSSSRREFDVIIFGASGYVGSLCVEYFFNNAPKDLKWAIAGRNSTKCLSTLKERDIPVASIPIIVADSTDDVSLRAMCSRANVILSAVGPFAIHGFLLASICVQTSTHYIDMSGEPQFVRKVIDTLHDDAVRKKCLLITSCGYDCVPSDLGNMMMLRAARIQYPGIRVVRVASYHWLVRTGISGGTSQTLLSLASTMSFTTLWKMFFDTAYLNSPGFMPPRITGDRRAAIIPIPRWSPDVKGYVAPFLMSYINSRMVRRANELRGNEAGYYERCGPFQWFHAVRMCFAYCALLTCMIFPPLRWLMSWVMPKSGEGPTRKQRDRGWFKIVFIAELENGRSLKGLVRSKNGDPNYKETAKMASEAALCVALQYGELPMKGGVLPPSVGLGEKYLNRLVDAGIEFGLTSEG